MLKIAHIQYEIIMRLLLFNQVKEPYTSLLEYIWIHRSIFIDVVIRYTAVAEDFQDLRNQTFTQSRYVYIVSEFVVNVTYPPLCLQSHLCVYFKCFWSVESTSRKKGGEHPAEEFMSS